LRFLLCLRAHPQVRSFTPPGLNPAATPRMNLMSTHRPQTNSLRKFQLAPLPAALMSIGLSLSFTTALAQQVTPEAENPAASTSPVQPLLKVEISGQRERYTVRRTSTGTRSDTPVEQIPQSVVSLPRELLEDQGRTTLNDALRNASSVNQVDPRDANNVVFKIRGFHAATVVDGVAVPGYFSAQESLAMVEQVDVLKGPSGALFGASQGMGSYGTLGGTVAITTRAADPSAPSRNVGLRVGSFGERAANFDLNQPLSSTLALRLGGEISRSDSETERVFFRRTALNPSLTWQPSADTKVVLRARMLDNATLDYSALPTLGTLDTSSFKLPRSTFIASPDLPETTQKSQGVNLQWSQRLGDVWSFQLTAAQQQAEVDQRGTWLVDGMNMMGCMGYGSATASGNLLCGTRMWDRFKTTSVSPSFTAKLNTGLAKHTVQLGLDHERTTDDAFMVYSNLMGPVSMNPVNLTGSYPAWSEPIAPTTPDMQNVYTARVLYAQDQMDWGAWHVLGSLRHSSIDITDVYPAWGVNNNTSNSKVTPRLGAVYDLSAKVSAFAGYAEGIKVPTLSIFTTPPKPETSTQKEIGLKLKSISGLSGTLAWFDLTRDNAVVGDPNNPGKSIQSGRHRARGIDADLRWQVNPAWSWLASLSQMTARVEQDTTTGNEGKVLFNMPERSARIATRYDVLTGTYAGLGAGLGLSSHGEIAGNAANSYFTPGATIWDAQLSYRRGDARYGLSVDNLLGREYYLPSAYFSGGQVMPNAPRTLRLSANFAF
jgi:iron complex outermembrane recepter protein